MKVRKITVLKDKYHDKPKFKVGDVIRRKPLAEYNYEQPVMKIAAISESFYVFEKKPYALEIWAQGEWELYNTWYRKLWRSLKNMLSRIFMYHQPKKRPLNMKHVGRQVKRPGLTLFMYNKVTGAIAPAPVADGKVIMEKDCIYLQALNAKNFKKKLRRKGIIK